MKQKPIILVTSFRELSPKGEGCFSVAVNAPYISALCSGGAIPLIVPLGLHKNELEHLTGMAQGLLIPGGEDVYPKRYGVYNLHEKSLEFSNERDELEIALINIFVEKKKPIFGVCRGEQIINVALGGTLYQDISSEVTTGIYHEYNKQIPISEYYTKDVHEVFILENTALYSFFPTQKIIANSLHHQAVKDVAPRLRVGALAPDGIIEAVESEDMSLQWILGVQWHPETLLEKHPENKILFEKFIEAASKKIA